MGIPHESALTGFGITPFSLELDLSKFTQELRATSTGDNTFDWMVGGFYTIEHVTNNQEVVAYSPALRVLPNINPFFSADQVNQYREFAGFGNATLKLAETLDVTAGLRVTRYKQSYDQAIDGPLAGGKASESANTSETVVNWSGNLRYRPTDLTTIYARVGNGFRPGAPNAPLPGVPKAYQADSLTNYEVGYKASLFDGLAEVNLAAFYIDWRKIQVTVRPANVSFIGNAGKASSRGLEASGTVRLTQELHITSNFSYTDAHLDEDAPRIRGLKGAQTPGSPKWTFAVSSDYKTKLAGENELILGLAYRYRGSSFTRVESDPSAYKLKPQNIVDAYAGVGIGPVSVRLYARNLLNDYSFNGLTGEEGTGLAPVQPRTIGLAADVSF